MIRLIQGDCRQVLKTLPADSVHCVVTSPPYWGLRDYQVTGQIGLEPSIAEYIAEMVTVFREVRRVLRPDGTLWLNLGDSYATGGAQTTGYNDPNWVKTGGACNGGPRTKVGSTGLKPKDLCGLPWRIAFALQADGWWLRQDIIWAKPNPMPESVTDRCTKAHEYLFLLSKSAKYFFDAEAIKEAAQSDHSAGNSMDAYHKRIIANSPLTGGTKPQEPWNDIGGKRNKRSVWTIATQPYAEAHFATFPLMLVNPCIKAGTSAKGCCEKCGAPWERKSKSHIEHTQRVHNHQKYPDGQFQHQAANRHRDGHIPGRKVSETTGWQPTCNCNAATVPCTVLDPFGGAGTTAVVADGLNRNAICIELNAEYVSMARKRLPRLFTEIRA